MIYINIIQDEIMNLTYSKEFFEDFYEENGGGNYLDRERWIPFFKEVAQKIVENFNPQTVLDAGCACGYLVECLRDLGVEAYGFDISSFSIKQVREDIKPYCFVHSITEPIPKEYPQKYDLVITIEVLEHLLGEQGEKAIFNLCQYSDVVIFSSTPDDIEDRTHVNVRPIEYWARIFAANKFTKELIYQPTYISPWAATFVRFEEYKDVIFNYELNMRINEMQKARLIDVKKNEIEFQLYYDDGGGFCEEDSIVVKQGIVTNADNTICVEVQKEVKCIRIDPICKKGIVYIKSICIENPLGKKIEVDLNSVTSNANKILENKVYQFDVDDAWIICPNVCGEISNVIVNIGFVIYDSTLRQIFNNIVDIGQDCISKLICNVDEKNILLSEQNKLVNEKEQKLEEQANIIEEKNDMISELESKLQSIKLDNEQLNIKNSELENEVARIGHQLQIIQHQKNSIEQEYQIVINAFFWKITKPLRVLCDVSKKIKILRLIAKFIKSIKNNGIKETYHKINRYLSKKSYSIEVKKFKYGVDAQTRLYQENYNFEKRYKISIVMPIYNTPVNFLDDMVNSLLMQTYSEWELCVADGSDKEHAYVKKYFKNLSAKDSRFKYTKLTRNGGIGINTIGAYKLATGEYIVLMDHDDILTADALFEINLVLNKNPETDFIYSDKGVFDDKTKEVLAYHYLPDYSPEFLRACNYASHLNAFSKHIIDQVGFIREGYDGSQDYEFELRVAEQARKIVHIDKVLYYCRACEGSVALNPENKMYAYEAGRKAIEEHINRIGYPGKVEFLPNTFSYRIHYDILQNDEVSIIIPNKDHVEDLKKCITSILEKTEYTNYKIIVVENNSVCDETFNYYHQISKNERVEVIKYQGQEKEFNYSKINNYAVQQCDSKYVLFLNNDTEVINPNWLTEMLMFAQRTDVGAVGAKLYYENETYQHIGLFIGKGNHIATHYAHGKNNKETGYMHRLSMPQNYNAVTAACLLVAKEKFESVNGFDEINFKVGLNDVDLCLKLREQGLLNVVTPYAELYHYESLSRGSDEYGENKTRFSKEQEAFKNKWKKYFDNVDEYDNINLEI